MKLGDLTTTDKLQLPLNSIPRNFCIGHQGNPDPALYDTSFNNGVILFMEDLYSSRKWHTSSASNVYANSDINSWLNGPFIAEFNPDTQNMIMDVKIPYRPGTSGTNVNSGANGLSVKAFLPSGREVGFGNQNYLPVDGATWSYFSGIENANVNTRRIAYLNGTATYWWLRSPYTNYSNSAWLVNTDGSYYYYFSNVSSTYGIRPAMTLDSSLSVKRLPTGQYTISPQPFLVSFSGLTYTHNGLDWASLGKSPSALTEQDFDEPVNPANLTASELGKLGSPVEILTLSDSTPEIGLKPGPQIVVPLNSMDLSLAKTIEQITAQDTGTVYRLLSLDNGLTWNTLLNGILTPISLTGNKTLDRETIRTHGLITSDLSNITTYTWAELFNASPVKRLSFLTLLDSHEAKTISITVLQDRYGHYQVAPDTDYDIDQYVDKTEVTVGRQMVETKIIYQNGSSSSTNRDLLDSARGRLLRDRVSVDAEVLGAKQRAADISYLSMMSGVGL
jgi:hypothetical protein